MISWYDIMVDRVKAFKMTLDASTESNSGDVSTEITKFYESKTSLLHYGEFALHPIIRNRRKDTDATPHAKSEHSEDAGKSESDSERVMRYHQQYITFNRVDCTSSLPRWYHYCEWL